MGEGGSEGAKAGLYRRLNVRIPSGKKSLRTLRLRGKEATNRSTIYCYRRGAEGAEGGLAPSDLPPPIRSSRSAVG